MPPPISAYHQIGAFISPNDATLVRTSNNAAAVRNDLNALSRRSSSELVSLSSLLRSSSAFRLSRDRPRGDQIGCQWSKADRWQRTAKLLLAARRRITTNAVKEPRAGSLPDVEEFVPGITAPIGGDNMVIIFCVAFAVRLGLIFEPISA